MGKKLTIYMIDGTEYGPRLGEIGNWVGKSIYSPRSSINKIISRSEFDNPGVYCLKGNPTDEAFEERIYIGEAENVRSRLKKHLSDPNRDFNELIFFISKDELLTKTQIRYLESRLIQLAREAKTAELENSVSPNLPTLHEADISDMEYFLEQIKLILPVMGFRFLIPLSIVSDTTSNEGKELPPAPIYEIRSPSFLAYMYESDKGYIVLKGSEAKIELSKSITKTYRNLRKKLLDANILVKEGTRLLFKEDTIFSSPSAASNMVLGRNSNGLTKWQTKEGKTFKEIQEKSNS